MDYEDLEIRPARFDEADLLSHICFRARSYWDYPRELMAYWEESGELSVSSEEIEKDPAYVIENGGLEVLGFYTMRIEGGECRIRNLCVLPEYVGANIRTMLFLHACELAETLGAESVVAVSDSFASSFYEEMGAERIGEDIERSPAGDRTMAVLKLDL
ncbi:MAG: GNAT family N-acetyltransferase [Synergistaceae bacterium]|jgi:N-acetylglutamate synthase-like GNAT family acetyltransferase|nr:GNAT family N-acetyltransferase [Synergistaceae bacterium]